ncbi:3-oxoacyl-[acyl-carrier-protein] synthase III C-terminal domain-containing protein (plasmid) [Brevibacillus halotolerans]|nr:3-oxoacyl-[acyl-carrier-protein] synthase III C-terminal domain-containing protein [Brevibacillus halotolerans]
MSVVIIKNTAIYHPQHRVNNEELANEFKKYGKDINHFLEVIGRKDRYLDKNGEETSVSMAIQATKSLLDKEGLSGKDIDIIVFSSGTPEYTIPANAVFIHKAIQGKSECTVYDMNANCVGMVVAIEQVIRTMQSNLKLKRAIVVGSEQMSQYARRTDEINRGVFGDGACAVLLERTENKDRGFIDSAYYTDSIGVEDMLLPGCGLSKAFKEETATDDRMISMIPGYQSLRLAPEAKILIENLLLTHGYTKNDVHRYFISQVSVKAGYLLSQLLDEKLEKFVYVGDRYGYTGTSSPLFALHHALEGEMIKEGDLFILWSVGAGQTTCGILFKR